jgi:uncharacterized repeat protein (TIGR03803 family)
MCGGVACGTVFSITTSGTEKVLHSFDYSQTDGHRPEASLIDVKGVLYGTTLQGGAYMCGGLSCGTVFSITTSGKEKVVYSFGGETGDGIAPATSLLDLSGTLYGTTSAGGEHGRGAVFIMSKAGKERVLYSFGTNSPDGTNPSSLVNIGGTLYGTTQRDGTGASGAVFSITKFGREKLLYSFNGSDGSQPIAGLIDVDGLLYGTTYVGGVKNVGSVFSITTSGSETVLHSFGSQTTGLNPTAALLEVDGTLYGTTNAGGNHNGGLVFALTP